jgi:hypothetical protein
MSLNAWEQQALDSIKDGLTGSHPTRHTHQSGPPATSHPKPANLTPGASDKPIEPKT